MDEQMRAAYDAYIAALDKYIDLCEQRIFNANNAQVEIEHRRARVDRCLKQREWQRIAFAEHAE